MKLIYTNENRFLVSNIKNIIQNAGIEIFLKNEYVAGGAGGLSPFDTWLEVWVEKDADYDRAMQLINNLQTTKNAADWVCPVCNETNNASFDFCWQCQHEREK
ncbi:hypothetical protein MNBD_GAMMA08-86 [hydrothermal vent metagenome]|uniref:RanBP2-type domain-containing protein n=1 Tax=hydrothermal vent metagenome TaxID=652676 RepID=A0A3B0YHM6_9ZZZZ